MVGFTREISDPDLRFTQVTPRATPRVSGKEQAIADVVKVGVKGLGKHLARSAGEEISGEDETFAGAEQAVAEAASSLETRLQSEQEAVEGPLSKGQIQDFRKEEFDKILSNQKRIRQALDRGLISSAEANARINTLRGDALSNPLIAAFQDDLDNALFKTTGGAAPADGVFGATAAEQNAAAARKGELAAMQEVSEDATRRIQLGLANSPEQAAQQLGQIQNVEESIQRLNLKKAQIGLTSDDYRVLSSNNLTKTMVEVYGEATAWINGGAGVEQQEALRRSLVAREQQAIAQARANAFDRQGRRLVTAEALDRTISDIGEQFKAAKEFVEDQDVASVTTRLIEQRQKLLDAQNQSMEIEVTKLLPLLNVYDSEEWKGFVLDNVTGTNPLFNDWQESTNPLIRSLGQLSQPDQAKMVVQTHQSVQNGAKPLDAQEKTIGGQAFVRQGGIRSLIETYNRDADNATAKAEQMEFRLKDIRNSREWMSEMKTEEGAALATAAIQGAANRAISDTFDNAVQTVSDEARGGAGGRARTAITRQVRNAIPSSVTVQQLAPTNPRDRSTRFEIDTGGVNVTDLYKEQVVNAFRIGTANPNLWNSQFETIDEWLNSLFTIPSEEE